MDKEFLREVVEEMVRKEKAAWISGNRINNATNNKSKVIILWHRPAEWAQMVYKCVERVGGIGSIYTVYDLFEGEDYSKEGDSKYLSIVLNYHCFGFRISSNSRDFNSRCHK